MRRRITNTIIRLGRNYFSVNTRRRIAHLAVWPPVGWINFGSFRRRKPIGRDFGSNRGTPIDRHYIEQFLAEQSLLIQGRVLEIGTDMYTKKFGGSRVTKSDVLHVAEQKTETTIIGDLTNSASLPDIKWDCIILTQTLQFIYDINSAVMNIYHLLKPGGCVLATVSGVAPISRYDMDRWGDYWRFTSKSVQRLFGNYFSSENLTVKSYGNVKACIAFLHGISLEEMGTEDLDYNDNDYELLIAVIAKKN